ncbi:hypothetical protein PR003_g16062 [Phytophthora rubi]|uniref:Pectate lyase n=1 Tax=Phytophthora rubi TaxID=129364 RepID=A0A6A4EJI6_9STRA|nr:hypothetical protein PR003_g16062 [Phytophthora rubi]
MKLHRGSAVSLVLAAATLAFATAIDFKADLSLKEKTSSSSIQQSTEQTSSESAVSLAPVQPVAACSDLLTVDLTAIGSNITSAKETDSNGITYCSVLPVGRSCFLGCGRVC